MKTLLAMLLFVSTQAFAFGDYLLLDRGGKPAHSQKRQGGYSRVCVLTSMLAITLGCAVLWAFSGKFDEIAVELKLLLSFIGVIGGFFLDLFGWNYFDNKRRFIGSALILIGAIVGAVGFGVWLL